MLNFFLMFVGSLVVLTGVALTPPGSRAIRRIIGLKPSKALAAAPPPPALPEPARPPTLYELAGVPTAIGEDRNGSWVYIVWNGREYAMDRKDGTIDADLLGVFIAQTSNYAETCMYCRGSIVAISQVARRFIPSGAQDLGLCERREVCRYCLTCGLRCSEGGKAPEPFRSRENLFDALNMLAADNGKLTKEIRYRMLEAEYARVQPEAVRIADQLRRLHAELYPRTDIDPYRGTPLAKLEDPPDDRAKAMPALVARNGPWGHATDE